MTRIGGHAICAHPFVESNSLFALLGFVVTGKAQALRILKIEKQATAVFVRDDVVNDIGPGCYAHLFASDA